MRLSLVGERRRGRGTLYAAFDRGRVDVDRLRTALAAVPRAAGGRFVLAVDVTCGLRPQAHTCPGDAAATVTAGQLAACRGP